MVPLVYTMKLSLVHNSSLLQCSCCCPAYATHPHTFVKAVGQEVTEQQWVKDGRDHHIMKACQHTLEGVVWQIQPQECQPGIAARRRAFGQQVSAELLIRANVRTSFF